MNLEQLIQAALKEDLPNGDVTTDALKLGQREGRARVLAKEDLVLSGQEVFTAVMQAVDPLIQLKWVAQDGQFTWSKQTVCMLHGPLPSLLKAERTALNFLGRLSGIATLTRCFVQQVEHTACRILDTRKTTPLLRDLEKTAVRHGGGQNHRRNLSEAVLLKDNHLRAVGGVRQAVQMVRAQTSLPIEVECETLAQVEEAVALKVAWILLDNFDDEQLKQALKLIPATVQTEASGNMTLDRVKRVAELGVTAISVGALTHSAPTADLSLEFEL
ncbi:MAG: carboxylating nicotinate-nucleotide diphosphorylase [Bdellovibrionales bacterium]